MAGKQWWHPDAVAERLPYLRARTAILGAIREFFRTQGFDEVETPYLQVSPGMEPHIMALATRLDEPFGQAARTLYLHTSPEFAMKKLLAGGVPRLFQLARVWRNGERSPTHHPEFTMLEWYRAGADYRVLMDDCERMLRALDVTEFRRGDVRCDPFRPLERLSVAEAFARVGIELFGPDLAGQARAIGLHVGETDTWDDVFFRVMLDRIEPHLGLGAPTILYDYPLSMAALSRPSATDPRVAERFELYVCGVELANAFSELTDPVEQRRRFEADMALKERLYGVRYPVDADFLAALATMPASAGIALGIDRLVMLATGAETIDQVLWAPVASAE